MDNTIEYPPQLESVRSFNPFATKLRYEDVITEIDIPFDRDSAWNYMQITKDWAYAFINKREQNA